MSDYIIKNYKTCRVGRIRTYLKSNVKNFLDRDRNYLCFEKDMCWLETVGKMMVTKRNRKQIEFCFHNLCHIDKPSHIYADHLIGMYEDRIKFLEKRKLRIVSICCNDNLENEIKEKLKKINEPEVLCILTNKIKTGLPNLSEEIMEEIHKNGIGCIMTDCLSIDPMDFPANSKKSNHYRFMEKGIIIMERVPLSIAQAEKIKFVRELESDPIHDAEAVSIYILK